ncbi:hypothetical protein NPIL_227151 [Nephila pilipes]|uniref:Uncharacterized protein n=1 Tax=Nephila pilipes TaxID=299642 RepID=A0A8X6MTD2_NEPPI|nr:hypothetical protein NPIL_227151 [Nephila pilipes]
MRLPPGASAVLLPWRLTYRVPRGWWRQLLAFWCVRAERKLSVWYAKRMFTTGARLATERASWHTARRLQRWQRARRRGCLRCLLPVTELTAAYCVPRYVTLYFFLCAGMALTAGKAGTVIYGKAYFSQRKLKQSGGPERVNDSY